MRGTGILLTRLVAVAALVVTVLNGPFVREHRGSTHSLVIGLLVAVVLAALLVRQSTGDDPVPFPPWVGIAAIVTVTVAGGVLCAMVTDGTAVAVPFVAALFTPRISVSRQFEICLVAADVAAVWGFCLHTAAIWWSYPAVLGGVLASYQTGLRTRERAERAENAELMLAKEQALRSERERAAAAAERERIARDLHDVLAHTLSGLAITLQGASMLLQADRPDAAQTQVDRARALAVEGLTEARQALAALAPESTDGDGSAPDPAPVELAAAVDRAARDHRAMTGNAVTVELAALPALPASVTGAVLAVLREGLTNVVRHAPGAPVTISARMQDSVPTGTTALLVTLDDHPGRPASSAGQGGMGVEGMRARIEAVDGVFTAGPTSTGWSVELTVPVIGQPTADLRTDQAAPAAEPARRVSSPDR